MTFPVPSKKGIYLNLINEIQILVDEFEVKVNLLNNKVNEYADKIEELLSIESEALEKANFFNQNKKI